MGAYSVRWWSTAAFKRRNPRSQYGWDVGRIESHTGQSTSSCWIALNCFESIQTVRKRWQKNLTLTCGAQNATKHPGTSWIFFGLPRGHLVWNWWRRGGRCQALYAQRGQSGGWSEGGVVGGRWRSICREVQGLPELICEKKITETDPKPSETGWFWDIFSIWRSKKKLFDVQNFKTSIGISCSRIFRNIPKNRCWKKS